MKYIIMKALRENLITTSIEYIKFMVFMRF